MDGLGCGADERTGRVRARRVGGRARRGVGERTWGGSVSCVQKVEAGHERVFVCVWVHSHLHALHGKLLCSCVCVCVCVCFCDLCGVFMLSVRDGGWAVLGYVRFLFSVP